MAASLNLFQFYPRKQEIDKAFARPPSSCFKPVLRKPPYLGGRGLGGLKVRRYDDGLWRRDDPGSF